MILNSLEELLSAELLHLRSAEKQLLNAYPKIQASVSSPELKEALKKHLLILNNQIKRLDTALNSLQIDPSRDEVCQTMRGLLAESNEIILSQSSAILKDAALIGLIQKIAHYKISGYGTAKAHAKILDLDEVADLLDATLDEEGSTDKLLTKLAEGSFFTSGINKQASLR